jgi:uroporphyrin-III C-methyltransferase/precorrin-2 dehydrogenase/sirohydrochlorin ferrochelatase
VLLMAVENLPAIASTLIEHGRGADTPVAVVQEGTMPASGASWQRWPRPRTRSRRRGIRPPAIVVVGDVVAVARRDA